jgi:hypothetical protein
MRRFGRWMFNGLTAMLLLLCVGLWIDSRQRAAQIAYWGEHARVIVLLDQGHILCELTRGSFGTPDSSSWHRCYLGWDNPGGFGDLSAWDGQGNAWYHRFGFAAAWSKRSSFGISPTRSVPVTTYIFSVPFWLLFLLISTPSLSLYRRRRQRRINALLGLCRICGYDLRATPDRCSECGSLVFKKTA